MHSGKNTRESTSCAYLLATRALLSHATLVNVHLLKLCPQGYQTTHHCLPLLWPVNDIIHHIDDDLIRPESLALVNRKPMTLRFRLLWASLPGPKPIRGSISFMTNKHSEQVGPPWSRFSSSNIFRAKQIYSCVFEQFVPDGSSWELWNKRKMS